ncbi:MAG: hypothetical protein V5783_05580 [Pontiella sp.]
MKSPRIKKTNPTRFLHEAFEEKQRICWQKKVRIRRNLCLWLFATAAVSVLYSAISQWVISCILSLFLAAAALILMSKFGTQLQFLKIVQRRDDQKLQEPDHS